MKASILCAAIAAFAVAAAGPSAKVQTVTITVDNGFKPDVAKVHAGEPVVLTFDTKHRACASTVVFKDLHMTVNLTDGKKTVVKFTPKKAGTIAFACGMNMLKGKVVVK